MVSLFLISNLNTQIGNLGNYCNFVGLEILMFYLTFFFSFVSRKEEEQLILSLVLHIHQQWSLPLLQWLLSGQ